MVGTWASGSKENVLLTEKQIRIFHYGLVTRSGLVVTQPRFY